MGDRGQGAQALPSSQNVVLFDALTLASDWGRMKEEAETAIPALTAIEPEEGRNPRDGIPG